MAQVAVRPFSVSGTRSRERRQQTEGARLLSSAAAGLVLCVVAIAMARFSGSYLPARTGLMATELVSWSSSLPCTGSNELLASGDEALLVGGIEERFFLLLPRLLGLEVHLHGQCSGSAREAQLRLGAWSLDALESLAQDAGFSARAFQQLQEGNGTEAVEEAPAEAPAAEGAAAAEGGGEAGESVEEKMEGAVEGALGVPEEGAEPECPKKSRLPNGKCPPKPHLFGGMGELISEWMIAVVLLPLLGLIIYFAVEVYWVSLAHWWL
jgi:hypothetical protein